MATTFPTGPDIDEKKFWTTDCSSNNNNNQFNYITSKGGGGGDVWIMGRVKKESYEKSKNAGLSNRQIGQDVDDLLSDNIVDSEEEDDYPRDGTKDDEDHLKRTSFQKKLYHFFEVPRSPAARIFSVFSALCTVGAVALICLNSLPKYELSSRPLLMPFRLLFNVTFTVEYLGRFFASVNKRKFLFGLMSLLDLIAIVPFFIQLAIPRQDVWTNTRKQNASHFLSILQLVRIVRLSDFTRHSVGFRAAMKVVRRSSNQILFMSFWYFAILILSSSLMFLTERGEFDAEQNLWFRRNPDGHLEISPFQSIIHSFYWSVVTLSTTGYGDDVPYTVWGRIVTGTAITCGILVLVIPASIIGSNLSVEWTRAHRLAKLKKTRQLAQTPKNPANIALWQMKYLQRRNRELSEAITEVQEVLADVNPRKYYRRYRKIQIEHVAALKKIAELEASLDWWKHIACNRCEHQQQRDGYGKRQPCFTDIIVDDKTCMPNEAVNEPYRSSVRGIESFGCMLPPPRMVPGFLTDTDMISDGDYQSTNETTAAMAAVARNDPHKQKSNNVLNPFKMFRRSSRSPKRDVPANTTISSFDTHSIEHSITAPESAYLYTNKDKYDHPQSVTTAPVKASVRLAPNDLLRSATLPCGECPKYNDKNVLAAGESGGLMDLFQQRIDVSGVDGGLNRRAVDESNTGSGDADADDDTGDIEIVVEREISNSDMDSSATKDLARRTRGGDGL